MSSDIMCNGHRFVKSSLFQSPGYLADLSPYITAVISSRLLATPIQLTASAIKPLAPLAHSILPTRATNFILSGTLTCEYCLHQVSQDSFDDGRPCPSLILDKLNLSEHEFVLADELVEVQQRCHVEKLKAQSQIKLSPSTSSITPQPSSESSSDKISSSERNNFEDALANDLQPPKAMLESNTDESVCKKNAKFDECHRYKDDLLIMEICPEVGLHTQAFSCVDCDKEIDLSSSRLCHYDGRYYCYNCHTGSDLLPIPARVLRNWDFTPKPVSKSSMQKICFLRTKPVLFNLIQINSMLYGFIDRLVEIKQIRERIQSMLKYLEVCGQPDRPHLMDIPKHFLSNDLLNFFTLNDLFDSNQVYDQLTQLQNSLETHIVRRCESCRGKGYYCELCKDPHDVLYPFSKNGASCTRCHTVYHKNCFHRKKKNCPRCIRLIEKKSSLPNVESELERDSSLDEDEEDDNEEQSHETEIATS